MAARTDSTAPQHRDGSALPAPRTPDLARAVETLVPDTVLARTDPALFGRTVLQLAQGWAAHPGEVGRAASSFATVSASCSAVRTTTSTSWPSAFVIPCSTSLRTVAGALPLRSTTLPLCRWVLTSS